MFDEDDTNTYDYDEHLTKRQKEDKVRLMGDWRYHVSRSLSCEQYELQQTPISIPGII